MSHLNRNLVIVIALAAVFVFFVPIVPSTLTTNADIPCALHPGYFCPFVSPSIQNPSEMVTYHLWSSISYSLWSLGIVYTPDLGGGLWLID